jgi:hypothetical protein
MLMTPLTALAPHLHGPEDSVEQRRVNAPAVLQHEQLVCELIVETTRADRPGVSIDLRHLHSGHHAQGVGNGGGTGAADFFLSNDVNGGGGF